jgi:DNA-binding transcriptional LysR family regulator
MDTQHLTAFIAVAEHHSFTLAAQQLAIGQSAVSKRIAALEQHLGQILFDRLGRQVVLTEAGHALLPKAKAALHTINEALDTISAHSTHVRGPLRIATSHHIGIHRLPTVLKHFIKRFPEVHLSLSFLDSEQAVEAITQGVFDLAFVALAENILEDPIHPIQHQKVWQDELHFVCGKEHPLAQRNDRVGHNHPPVTLEAVSQYPAIMPGRQTQTTQLTQRIFQQAGQSLDITMTTNHLDAIHMLISLGLGWSVLPKSLVSETTNIIPLVEAPLKRHLGCIYPRNRTLTTAARAMLELLRQA